MLGIISASPAAADAIPYPNAGDENRTQYTFTATASGDLVAYSYSTTNGGRAGLDEEVGVLINGTDSGVVGLDNQSANPGDSLNFGHVNMGDTLIFYIALNNGGDQKYYSTAALNPGLHNQVYSADFAGDTGLNIPQGTYVGFEDLNVTRDGFSDYNYQDTEFVFTNTSTIAVPAPVPLPASAPMFGVALVALGTIGYGMNRKRAAT